MVPAERAQPSRGGSGGAPQARRPNGRPKEQADESQRLKALHFMKCPKCGHDLRAEVLEGITIDRCTFCEGYLPGRGRDRAALLEAASCPTDKASCGGSSGSREPESSADPRASPLASAEAEDGQVPYLIDGNNLLGSWGGPTREDDRRPEVVRRVAAFCRAKKVRATLVFDGHPLRPDMAAQDLGPLSAARAPRGQRRRHGDPRAARPDPKARRVVVVTSDKAVYSYAKTRGASRPARPRVECARAPRDRRTGPGGSRAKPEREKPEQEDDVAGWLKKFGGE